MDKDLCQNFRIVHLNGFECYHSNVQKPEIKPFSYHLKVQNNTFSKSNQVVRCSSYFYNPSVLIYIYLNITVLNNNISNME